MKNKKGFTSLIAILVIMVIFFAAFAYLWNSNWIGEGIKVPSLSGGTQPEGSAVQTNPVDINNQLNTLRNDVKNLQNQKDQEIINELDKK